MTITERTAYLKGLLEGLDLDGSTKEGKLLVAIVDTLNDMAAEIADMDDELKAVDEDLASMEDDFYEDDEDECCECDDEEDETEDDRFYEVECPNCNNTIYLDEDLLMEGVIECPECGEKVELELDDSCECGCECGCDTEHDDK